MKRLSVWQAPLEQLFLAGRSRTFAWGSFDCALFACDCILAETGEDTASEFRGKYSTEAEARIFGSLNAIAERITAQFAMPEILPGHAGRGDLVLIANGTAESALAIVDFSAAYAVCPGARGLIRVRRHRWQRAWRVG
jgi:hypothetical protein